MKLMTSNEKTYPLSVIAAGYVGPSMVPNIDAPWRAADMPIPCDDLVQTLLGQPMRRAGRFIKLVCSGAAACLKNAPSGIAQSRRTGILLATGLGNGDEILPFITQVFLHDGGFPRPNQFANSVSNAAAFFLAQQCGIKGVILTLSDEELSFESALWLAQSYLAAGDVDLMLVGGCDVYTPKMDEYLDRMNVNADNARSLPIGEGSSWLLMGGPEEEGIGKIGRVEIGKSCPSPEALGQGTLDELLGVSALPQTRENKRLLLPGFRMKDCDGLKQATGVEDVDDYLSCCGIHPTAAAFGLARAMLHEPSSVLVHYNRSASGKPALIIASTK